MSSIVPRTNSTSSTQSILQLHDVTRPTWVVSTAPVGYRRASSDRSIVLLSSLTMIATTRRTEEHCQQTDSQHHQQLHQPPCQSVSQSGGADGKASERHAACTAVNYEIQANLHADTVMASTCHSAANESVPIQLAQCRFPVLAIPNAKIMIFYPRESFREGLCNHRRTFVCLFVCYHDN